MRVGRRMAFWHLAAPAWHGSVSRVQTV